MNEAKAGREVASGPPPGHFHAPNQFNVGRVPSSSSASVTIRLIAVAYEPPKITMS